MTKKFIRSLGHSGIIALASLLTSYVNTMSQTKRLIIAPLLGTLVGAIEGGFIFFILTLVDAGPGRPSGWDDPWLPMITMYGTIYGGFIGGGIGLGVALMDLGGRGGLAIGSVVGVLLAIHVFKDTGPHDDVMRMLAVIVIPAAQSMGLLSAVLTGPRKKPEPSVEPPQPRYGRILS